SSVTSAANPIRMRGKWTKGFAALPRRDAERAARARRARALASGASTMNSIWDFPTKSPPHSGTCRMFQSDLVERFSRIHPSTPFVAWLPVIAYVLYRSASRHDLSAPGIVGLFVLGAFTWTLAEYVLHRYVFHWIEDSPRGRRVHFLVHGVHH